MKLSKHVNFEPGLSDLLNYAHFVDEGILINKDGAFVKAFSFRGPDLNSSDDSYIDGLSHMFNRMALCLGDGWMVHVDELRVPSLDYPLGGHFNDAVSWLIDEERRGQYEEEGRHYENLQFLTFVWKFPMPKAQAMKHWFVEGVDKSDSNNLTTLLNEFNEVVDRALGLLGIYLQLTALNSGDLLSFLNTCISGELLPVIAPKNGCFIDVVLGRRPLVGGYVPRIGNKHIYVLSVMGFNDESTMSGILDSMGTYGLVYRWSNRFVPLSQPTAEREIKRYQKNWNNKVKGFLGIVKEVVSGKPSLKLDGHALSMSQSLDAALHDNSSNATRFGYWSSELVLMHENESILTEASKSFLRYFEQSGFSCMKEDINALDAWLGTIPGHGASNLRRQFVHSMNMAHLMPLHSIWAGSEGSDKGSFLPLNSPPVFYAATTGNTPFRFHLDVGDVGHQMVLGPTGAGKSTYLDLLITQFLRYENARVFVFDKDKSHEAIINALGGTYRDIGECETPLFCPLVDLSTEALKTSAAQFIEDLVELQGVNITPEIRQAIYKAIVSLSDDHHKNHRNLTVFQSEVQHEEVRAALQYYTISGQMKFLDASVDVGFDSKVQGFEMGWLLSQKPTVYVPILRHIFDSIDRFLDEAKGSSPTLIVLEEAWLYLIHDVFLRKLIEWLKTLRKKNARVVFTSQSLADLYCPETKTLTKTTAAILESCFTRVFLPNQHADESIKALYRLMKLSDRQVDIITKESIPKKHYYVSSTNGNRLIELGLFDKSLARSFIGLSKEKSEALKACQQVHQNKWLGAWLADEGHINWLNYLETTKFGVLNAA